MAEDPLIGSQIDEYSVEKLLGQGGMARVYRALDTKLLRYVALKVIAPDLRTDTDYARRFEREAQAVARLEHPNIVRIYRFGEVDDLYYIAMQYIEGADIGWLIRDYKKHGEVFPIRDVINVVRNISAALDYAHSRGVIHRDVKPGNIMVDGQGNAYLTDFGLALPGNTSGQQGGVFMGSPHYIAPEQAVEGGQVVPQTDFYALGVTVFEMLTGEVPFTGENATAVATKHVMESPPPPSQFDRSIPPAVDKVILRCLEKDPARRYETGAGLSFAFQEAVAIWRNQAPSRFEGTLTPSTMPMPEKVSQRIAAVPLPKLPGNANVTMRSEPPPVGQFMPPPSGRTGAAAVAEPIASAPRQQQPQPSPRPPAYQPDYAGAMARKKGTRGIDWRLPWIILAGVLLIGVIACLGLFALGARNLLARPVVPTATPYPTLVQTNTPTNIATSPAVFPTSPAAIPTAVILPTTQSFTPISPATSVMLPPNDRSVVPPNSRRLGEFQVEWYCNERGYGVILTNNQIDWACTNRDNNSILFVLAPADFDAICRRTYNNPGAFAIRDQHKDVQAYNWSCYDFNGTSG